MSTIDVAHLRPLSMGEILDRALRLYRRNFAPFVGLAALIQIPVTLLALIPQGALWAGAVSDLNESLSPELGLVFAGVSFVVVLLALGWSQVGAAAFIRMTTDTYLDQPTGVFEAIRKIGHSWWSLIGALLWFLLFTLLAVIIMIIPCVGWALAVPGLGMAVFAGTVVIQFVGPVVVLERLGGRKALRRAWDLARQRFWWLFGFFLLVSIFTSLITQGPVLFISTLIAGASAEFINPLLATIIQLVISGLLGIFFLPIPSACLLLAYFDTRIRQEGLDLALQTMQGSDSDAERILQQTPSSPEPRLIVGGEWGKFMAITGIIVALFLVFFLIAASIGLAFPLLMDLP
jgi:hypothetical protein